ncbi:hypothetical protein [Mycoplasmopsis arginini]|uniref:hypothetical protein n=1 Tax=Mycoplasmopsis arginini TaxID=2094 RepID=UPI00249F585D|nr:hypothetical protein [Mycoplasmopsis arginini]MDI3349041.1 hypothetical protein [Mycoplasmopsis arginini]MDI3351410.1 hypothetical protein [Mycoplasmopsis arginini]MDI3351891.1 hypothetical protein [Mycoplasmopsis arginini]
MKKSRKLVIGLTFLTAAATAALATTVVGILKNQNLPTENKLWLSKKKLGEKVNETKELIDKLLDPKYKDIRKNLQDALDETNKNITKDSNAEDYDKQVENLSKVIEGVKKDKEQIDNNDGSLEKLKKEYEKAKKSAEDLSSKLTDDEYKTVKDKLDKDIAEATKNINENSSKEDYKLATEKLNKAIDQAKIRLSEFDQLVLRANELDNAIGDSKYYSYFKDQVKRLINDNFQPQNKNHFSLLTPKERKQKINILRSEVNHQEATLENYLLLISRYLDLKKEAEAFSQELSKNVIYRDIQNELEKQIFNSEDNIKKSNYVGYYGQDLILEEALKLSKQNKKAIDIELARSKSAYENEKELAQQLVAILNEKSEYSEIKQKLNQEIESASYGINDNSAASDYWPATLKLQIAINEAKEAKNIKDKQILTLEEAKAKYESKVTEALKLSDDLNKYNYRQLKQDFDKKFSTIKEAISASSLKEDYLSAIEKLDELMKESGEKLQKLDKALEKMKAFENKELEVKAYRDDIMGELRNTYFKNYLLEKIEEIKTGTNKEDPESIDQGIKSLDELLIETQNQVKFRETLWNKLLVAKEKYKVLAKWSNNDSEIAKILTYVQNEIERVVNENELVKHASLNNSDLQKRIFEIFQHYAIFNDTIKHHNENKIRIDELLVELSKKDIYKKLKQELELEIKKVETESLDNSLHVLSHNLMHAYQWFLMQKQNLDYEVSNFESRLKEANNFADNDLIEPKYYDIREELKNKVSKILNEVSEISDDAKTREFLNQKNYALYEAIQHARNARNEIDNLGLEVGVAKNRYEEIKHNAKNYIQKQLNQPKYSQIKNELQSKIEKIEAEVISSPATKELFDQKQAELIQWLVHAQNEKARKDAKESADSSTAR